MKKSIPSFLPQVGLSGALVALVLCGAGNALGVALPVAATTPLPGTTVAAQPDLAGVILVDQNTPFSINFGRGAKITGHVQERVVRSAVDGSLDFYWRVFNDPNSAAGITSFRLGDFITDAYDGNWRIDGLGDTHPTAARNFGGGFVNFLFSELNPLAPGHSSKFMFLDTDATSYGETAKFDLTSPGLGAISASFKTFAPRKDKVPDLSGMGINWLAAGTMLGWVAMKRRAIVPVAE